MASSTPDPSAIDFERTPADPEVLARTTRSLRRLAKSVVGDDATADDIVQGAWVAALEKRPVGIGIGWLLRVVRSRSIDVVRHRSNAPTTVETEAEKIAPDATEQVARTIELQRNVLAAVDSLAEPYRTTIYLRYFESMGPGAIAERLGVPEKTVATRLTRAHRQLRQRFQTTFQENKPQWTPALFGIPGFRFASAAAQWTSTIGGASTLVMKKPILFALVASLLTAIWLGVTHLGSARVASPLGSPAPAPGV